MSLNSHTSNLLGHDGVIGAGFGVVVGGGFGGLVGGGFGVVGSSGTSGVVVGGRRVVVGTGHLSHLWIFPSPPVSNENILRCILVPLALFIGP